MSELTPEEKQRIYEEEKARLEAQEKAKADLQKEKNKQVGIGCLVLIVIIAALALWIGSCGDSSGPRAEHDALTAYHMSHKFVEKRLVAPATAKFPRYEDKLVANLGEGRYLVSAYVDSENRFGAMIRTRYVAQLLYVGDDRWQLEDLQILE